EADEPEVVQRLHEEARVDQVHRRVVDAADVLVDGAPPVTELLVERRLVVVRIAVTHEVPGRVDEGVHRLDLAPSLAAAAWASRPHPFLGAGERRDPPGPIVLEMWQHDGQLLVRDRNLAALLAVHNRDRAAPVALTR